MQYIIVNNNYNNQNLLSYLILFYIRLYFDNSYAFTIIIQYFVG